MQCFDSLLITKKCYLVICGRITEKFDSALWLIVAVLTLVCCALECPSRQSRLSVWRREEWEHWLEITSYPVDQKK